MPNCTSGPAFLLHMLHNHPGEGTVLRYEDPAAQLTLLIAPGHRVENGKVWIWTQFCLTSKLVLFPTTALKKNKCKTQTGGKDESRWECPPLSDGQALIGRDFISGFAHHWPHCSCFSILFGCLNPAPGGSVGAWQLMEQKGTWIAQPWGSFSQGPGFLCNLVVRKEALFCPHCKAGLGGCPWETALISSAPPLSWTIALGLHWRPRPRYPWE